MVNPVDFMLAETGQEMMDDNIKEQEHMIDLTPNSRGET